VDNIRDIFGNEHVTDKMCLNVLKSIFDVLKEIRNNYIQYFKNPQESSISAGFLYFV